jgi:hypothetical protein
MGDPQVSEKCYFISNTALNRQGRTNEEKLSRLPYSQSSISRKQAEKIYCLT